MKNPCRILREVASQLGAALVEAGLRLQEMEEAINEMETDYVQDTAKEMYHSGLEVHKNASQAYATVRAPFVRQALRFRVFVCSPSLCVSLSFLFVLFRSTCIGVYAYICIYVYA